MNPKAYIDMDKTESKHWWFLARRSIISQTIKDLNLPENAKILEVGCGTGGNLEMLSKFGEVSALDMDITAIALASKKTSNLYDIRKGYCPNQIPFDSQQSFDLICMFDVLEHIEEDIETLVAIRKLLSKKGKVLLTVPAYQWLFGTHDIFLHHKRRYSAAVLREKVLTSQLNIIKLSYFNMILFPLAVVDRTISKLFNKQSVGGATIPSPIINQLFKKSFGFERFLLKYTNLPFGLSLLCVVDIAHM